MISCHLVETEWQLFELFADEIGEEHPNSVTYSDINYYV